MIPWTWYDIFGVAEYVLLVFGLLMLVFNERKVMGFITLFAGISLWITENTMVDLNFMKLFIPLVFVGVGLSFFFKKKEEQPVVKKKVKKNVTRNEILFPKEIYGDEFHDQMKKQEQDRNKNLSD